jgi:hypothetical protein
LNGNDITNAGSVSADTLEADDYNNADVANADAGDVPTAQGDGTLSMSQPGATLVNSGSTTVSAGSSVALTTDATYTSGYHILAIEMRGDGNGAIKKAQINDGVGEATYFAEEVGGSSDTTFDWGVFEL